MNITLPWSFAFPWTRANTRQLFLTMNYLAYYFVPPLKYCYLLIHSRVYLKWIWCIYTCVGRWILKFDHWNLVTEIWSNEFQYVSFNVFIVSLSSWQVSFGEGAKGNVRGFLNNFMKFKKCKLINSKILEPLSWKYRGKDGGYLRKYKVFDVYRPKISSWQHEKSKF